MFEPRDEYYQPSLAAVDVNALLRAVYNWMAIGLAVSGVTAYITSNSPFLLELIFGNSFTLLLLLFAELGLVFAISGGARSLRASTAVTLFMVFSFINGLTLSGIFLVYTAASLTSTFLITAGTFAATSAWGYATKKDLSAWGNMLFMGLIGIIIASVVNMFLHSSTLQWVVSYLGVFIFVGLTAYDTQKIKRMGETVTPSAGDVYGRLAIIGALTLYLDFINLFLFLLRIFGGRRD